jgi:Holliday junction resolvase
MLYVIKLDSVRRYPVRRTEYCKIVGETRVDNISKILKDFGFNVVVGKIEDDDVDILVYRNDELVLVIEVLNWRKNVYMDYKRVRSIKRNFSNPKYSNARKLLIFSFRKNIENQLRYFQGLNIDLLEVGFQTQPTRFYKFFKRQGKANDMRPNNSRTRQLEKRKLAAYLQEKDII